MYININQQNMFTFLFENAVFKFKFVKKSIIKEENIYNRKNCHKIRRKKTLRTKIPMS